MSGMKTININKYNNQVAIDLRRAVTKLSLTVENATNGPIVLQNVEFGSFLEIGYMCSRSINLMFRRGLLMPPCHIRG